MFIESVVSFWNACKIQKQYQHHLQLHVKHSFSKYAITAQSNIA